MRRITPACSSATYADGAYIAITNHGPVTATYGIDAHSSDDFSPVAILNTGNIDTYGGGTQDGVGIRAGTSGYLSPITLSNSGDIAAESANFNAFGINAATLGPRSPIAIENTGDIAASGVTLAIGINATTNCC